MILGISFLRHKKLNGVFLFIFFLLISVFLYYPSLNNFFVLDDFIFLKAASDGSMSANFHFFPAPLLVYRIIYLIFGLNPVPIRILNIALNAFICVLVYKFSLNIFLLFDKKIDESIICIKSFICSILFCILYFHVETVVYFSELHELLYSLFYILGLISYLLYKRENKNINLFLIFLFYSLSLLSKENAVTFIFCLFFSEIILFKSNAVKFGKKYHYLFSISFIFIFLRYVIFSSLEKFSIVFNVLVILKEMIKNLVFTFTLFIVPLDFTFIKDIYKFNNSGFVNTLKDIFSAYPAALLSILLSLIIYWFILKKGDKVIYLTFSFILITISSFVWLAGYERYFYLPSIGFCIMIVHYAFNFSKKYAKNAVLIIFVLFFTYNIYSLEQKQGNWIKASEISFNTVSHIINLTKELPSGSEVYFKDLPGDYKGAWILRDGIHQIPELFLKRNDIKFYYMYEMQSNGIYGSNIYVYDYWQKKLYQN